jgi:hypothetical protein
MAQVRRQAERVIYYAQRAPLLIQWQVQDALLSTLESAEVRQATKSSEVISQAADRIVGEVTDFPAEITRERQAALEQIDQLIDEQRKKTLGESADLMAKEREAIVRQADELRVSLNQDVTQHINHVSTLLNDFDKTVERFGNIAKSTTDSANYTVNSTHGMAGELIDRLFYKALILSIVIIGGIPLARRFLNKTNHRG